MGKVKLFPTAEYTSKQPRDPIVPRVPCTGIFLGPSKSGKTVALISAILDQYMTGGGQSVFERIYIFSPSIEIDDAWKPVKGFIEQHMGVNTERGAGLLRQVGRGSPSHHHPAAEEDHPDHEGAGLQEALPNFGRDRRFRGPTGAAPPHRGRGPGHALHPRAPHADLHRAAVRVNMQFMCVWRLRNQLELEAVLEELTALLPRKELQAIYEEATREPYSFLFIHYLKPRAEMFYKRWEERFVIENGDDPEPSGGQDPGGRPGLRQ